MIHQNHQPHTNKHQTFLSSIHHDSSGGPGLSSFPHLHDVARTMTTTGAPRAPLSGTFLFICLRYISLLIIYSETSCTERLQAYNDNNELTLMPFTTRHHHHHHTDIRTNREWDLRRDTSQPPGMFFIFILKNTILMVLY